MGSEDKINLKRFHCGLFKQSFAKRGGKCWKRTPSRKDSMEHAKRYSECEGVTGRHSPMGRVLKRKTDKLIEKFGNFAK